MAVSLNDSQKKDALNNALRSFNFPSHLFIHSMNEGKNIIFAIAYEGEHGSIYSKTIYMNYDNMNAFLKGYNAALTRPIF